MKDLLFIFLICFLASCATSKLPNQDSNFGSNKVETSDTLQNNELKSEDLVINDSLQSEMILVNELKRSPYENIEYKDKVRLIERHEKKTQLQVIDRTSTVSDSNKGWIAYSVPEEMKVAKSYSIKVRISKKNGQSKADLILGSEDAINNPNYSSIAMIEDVKVSGEMSAELRGDTDEFKIVSLSTSNQNIDDESYTEWEWIVTPLKDGESPLKLVIKLKDLNKDIIVFNKTIKIKSNIPVVVEGFFEKYWQWIMTTIIIPIFLYFWNRKRKEKKS